MSRLCCPLVISDSVRVCSFTLSGVALSDRARLCIVRSLLIVLSELVLVFRGVRSSGPVIVLQSSNSVITSASALGPFIARKSRLPPYSTSLCCAERAAVGSPTTSSTRRTTHHLTSVEHADPAERLRVTGIIHIDIGIAWRGLQARAEALGKGERATCGRQNLFRRRPAITCPSRPVGPHPPVFSTRHRRTSIA